MYTGPRLAAQVRGLKNQLQELRGHVRVFVRFPPPRPNKPETQCWCRPSGDKHVLIKPPQFDREVDFAFDKARGGSITLQTNTPRFNRE